jgi:hypothetical protein
VLMLRSLLGIYAGAPNSGRPVRWRQAALPIRSRTTGHIIARSAAADGRLAAIELWQRQPGCRWASC